MKRKAKVSRKTKETSIDVEINIDGKGKYKIDTGIGFLNHMLEQLSKHSSMDISVKAKGDTHIDLHHTTEDTGIAIGECLRKASKKFVGIKRYAHAMIPMDETLSRVAIDMSNRPYLIWKVNLKVEKLGEMDTELFKEWFQAFSQSAGITLHVENIYGDNSHHIIESCYKGLARSLRAALEIDPKKQKNCTIYKRFFVKKELMKLTIVDYNSGNISSVINSFIEVAQNKVNIEVTSDLNKIKSSDKIVLPGQGSFKSCVDALNSINGLVDSLNEFAISNKKPLLGICVGLQMFADTGYEETETKGLGWISGKVSKINNQNGKYKLPHIGWNQIDIIKESKIFRNIENNSHMYFVHSYEFIPEDKNVISSTTDYSTKVVCSVEKENLFGTQFHPEKSDRIGLKIIDNFINL